MITDEMVEAAARAACDAQLGDGAWQRAGLALPSPEAERNYWRHSSRAALSAVAPLIAAAERERGMKPDMFWDANDPEYPRNDVHDFISDGDWDRGAIYEVQQAVRLENVFVWVPPWSDEDDPPDEQVFATREEAEAAAIRARGDK